MPHSIPSRCSDSGPQSPARCPVCDSRKWATLAHCEVCGDKMCNECPGALVAEVGLICAACAEVYIGAGDVRIDEIDALMGGLTIAQEDRLVAQLVAFLESYPWPVAGREVS